MLHLGKYMQLGFKIPMELVDRLDKLQTRRYTDRASLLREATQQFLDREEKRLALQDAEMRQIFSEAKATEAA